VEVEVNNKKYKTEELVLFKHFKQTLEVLFQSFDKASIYNIQKGNKLIAALTNFSKNAFSKKNTKKKGLHASELKFIEEIYTKNEAVYDEIVAVNMLVFLVRIGMAKVDSKEQKISYNPEVTKKVL
jgi:hypothetical protein